MRRRDFIRSVAVPAATGALSRAQGPAANALVELRPQEPGAVISPQIYGHFIEHLGGVIYDGVWVGRNSKIPNVDGIRKQFIDDMKRIQAPNLRWPGGCFADGYHWRDGIGPLSRRPRTYNFWHPRMPKGAEDTEPNHFGTHEFMRLCELLNAEPYLAGNVGSGTPRELYDWVLYCNAPPGSVSQADERAANGHREPFNVKYWGVGNESWGCGGYFKPQEYANEYRRYIAQLPRYSPMSLVAAGPSGGDLNWTRGFFETMPRAVFQTQPGRQPIHGWALHYYTQFRETANKAVGFTSKQWYEVLDSGRRIESLIESHWKIMGEFDPDHRVKLVIDEWGTWYPAGSEIKPAYILSQMITLRDALHTGINLDIFQRHAGKILMCNVAQTINCLHSLFLADGARYVRTPAYYVFEMYMPHMGGRLIPMQVQAESESVAGSASMQGNQITVTLVNPSLENSLNLTLRLAGATVREAKGTVLTHSDMRAANTFDTPEQITPKALAVGIGPDKLIAKVPEKSVTALQLAIS